MPKLVQRASRAAVADVFADVKPRIDRIAVVHAYRYRREPDEIKAEAYLHFLEAYHKFAADRGTTVEQRVAYIVKTRLLDRVRDEIEKAELLRRSEADVGLVAARPVGAFDLEAFATRLGDDALTVVRLLFDTPRDLLDAIRSDPNPGPSSVRRCLHRYLRGVIGWTADQVREAFEDIKEVIS